MEEHDSEERHLEEKLTLACELIERRLNAIWSAVDSVDTKINIALGFASTILVLLAGFYSLGTSAWPFVSLVLFGLALLAYTALAILSALAYMVRAWSYRPDPDTLVSHCKNKDYCFADIKQWISDECKLSCYDNLEKLKRKATLTNWILGILTLQTILIVFGLAYAIFTS
jgi:hypothetical protein